MQILLSRTQTRPGRTVKQEQEEISPNHVQRLNLISVLNLAKRLFLGCVSLLPRPGGITQPCQQIPRSAKVFVRGYEKCVPALACLFCLALSGSCLARFAYFLTDLCICNLTVLYTTPTHQSHVTVLKLQGRQYLNFSRRAHSPSHETEQSGSNGSGS